MDLEAPQGEGVLAHFEEGHELAEEAAEVPGVYARVLPVHTVICIPEDV